MEDIERKEHKSVSTEGLAQSKEELVEKLQELEQPLSIDELKEILGSTVRHDDDNKVITFLTMLLTYTEEDQINLGFFAESSTGKSYIPLELSAYFPNEDVIKLGYASPTAFFHEFGELVTDPVDNKKFIHVHLENKIVILLDQPHDQLLQRLRSLLSHDEKLLICKITDRREKSGLRTKEVIIHGFPTWIFCTAKTSMHEQERTRLLLLSPESNQEKLRETIALRIDKEGDRAAFKKRMIEDRKRQVLAIRVSRLKSQAIKYVIIPEDLRTEIYDQFTKQHITLIARHQRDITRLMAIIKGSALLNFMHRNRVNSSVIVNREDVINGFALYSQVSEANEMGLSPEMFHIWQQLKPYFEDAEIGLSRKDLQGYYYKTFYKNIGREAAMNLLKAWESVGIVIEQPDPNDRRILRYTNQNNVYPECGVNRETTSIKHGLANSDSSLPHSGDTHSLASYGEGSP